MSNLTISPKLLEDPFRVVFYHALQSFGDVETLQDRIEFLDRLSDGLHEAENSVKSQNESASVTGIIMGFSALIGVSVFVSMPILPIGVLAAVGSGSAVTGIASSVKRKFTLSPVQEELERHYLALVSTEAINWASLWDYCEKTYGDQSDEVFRNLLFKASRGSIHGDRLVRGKASESPFSAAIKAIARRQGRNPEDVASFVRAIKESFLNQQIKPVDSGWVPMPQAIDQPQLIGSDTRLNAVEVPAVAPEVQSQTKKSNLFDFNVLRTQPDNFTAFAIVADPGGGKTRLIKYLARNILTTGRMSVMDIYARKDDWQNALVMRDTESFLSEISDDLDEIESEIQAYRDGKNEFQPHLFVVEEAANTLSEAKSFQKGSDKVLSSWLSKYLTVTRKIGKRLCLVSVNIRDITDAIGSAEKRNTMVFIFPGVKGIAKAMTDSYIFKLGASENINLRMKLEKELKNMSRPALVYYRGEWIAAEIPEVNSDGSLLDGSSPPIVYQPQTQAVEPPREVQTPSNVVPFTSAYKEHKETIYSPCEPHEVDEDVTETSSSLDEVRQSFPTWKPKTLDIASTVIDWLSKREGQSFTASDVRKNIRRLKDDQNVNSEKLTRLFDVLSDNGFLVKAENKYSVSSSVDSSDDGFDL